MIYTSTMTSKGQVVIPKPIRDALGFKPGGVVVFEPPAKHADSAAIRRVRDIVDMAGALKPRTRKTLDPVKARAYMETHYERA